MTSKSYTKWILSDLSINHTESLVAKTLDGYYNTTTEKKNEILYIFYNDQPSQSSSSSSHGISIDSKGHTKGIILSDKNEGIWLIHSVPHFPYSLDTYIYPDTAKHYGQSFLCISMNLTNLNSIGIQLQYNAVQIFARNIPKNLATSVPELVNAANNKTINIKPYYRIATIESLEKQEFISFAKSKQFNKDLYADLINVELKTDLYVETWPNEPNRLPSECDQEYHVYNIDIILIPDLNVTFKTTVDHSKWAVSSPTNINKWICIGDINRAQPQTHRGGGSTCLSNEILANNYETIINHSQKCTSTINDI